MRILVTGSTGQIGSYTVDVGREQGHEMHGLDLRPHETWTDFVGDIRNPEDCLKATKGMDAIIHCAAQISVQASIEDPVFDATTNVLGTINMLQAAVKNKVKRFVNVSSAAVYGNPVRLPVDIDHPIDPLSPYGASKASAETYTAMYNDGLYVQATSVRPFNVYSERQDPSNPYSGVLSKFVLRVLGHEPPIIFGDGNQTRDFIHAYDVARALLVLAELKQVDATYNVGTGRESKILAIAEHLVESRGLDALPIHKPPLQADIMRSVALVNVPNWNPTVDLERGLEQLVAATSVALPP